MQHSEVVSTCFVSTLTNYLYASTMPNTAPYWGKWFTKKELALTFQCQHTLKFSFVPSQDSLSVYYYQYIIHDGG